MQGICKLCKKEKILLESHFIPNFAIKWLKNSSGTGHLRSSKNVNRRIQDYIKKYWLCGECENIFSQWESNFSVKIFYPFINDNKIILSYGEWLAKFAASLSWRTLTYFQYKCKNDVDIVE